MPDSFGHNRVRVRIRQLLDARGSAGLLEAAPRVQANTCSIRPAWLNWVGYGL